MHRLIRKAVLRRLFSTQPARPTPQKPIIDFVKQFRDDKDIIHSRVYQALLRVFEYQQRVTHKCEDLVDYHRTLRANNAPANLELMTEYFRVRKDFGFDEQILAQTFHLLSLQDQRGQSWKEIGLDLYGYDLLNSPIFGYMIDDVKLLLLDKVEVDLDALRLIVKALTRLQFRDYKFLVQITEKIEKLLDFDSSVLGEKENHLSKYFIRPSLDNYVNLPQKSVLQKALQSIIGIKENPGLAMDALREVKVMAAPDLEHLERAMDQLEKVVKNYSVLNLDFIHTIYSIREYYFDLKSEERMAFMQQNPDLLLDFLRLEQKLLMCGFLMPKNLLENNSKELKDVKLLVDQFLFQQKIDPKVTSLLIRTADLMDRSDAPPQDTEVKDTIQPGLVYSAVMGVLEEMLNWSREKFPCNYPEHDFADPAFAVAAGGAQNTLRLTKEKRHGRMKEELTGKQFMINQNNARLPHYGYTKSFRHLCGVFDSFIHKFEGNYGPNRLNLADFDLTLLIQVFILARRTNRLPLAKTLGTLIVQKQYKFPETPEAVIPFVAGNLDFVSHKIFRGLFFNRNGNLAAVQYIQERINNPLVTLEDKFTALCLGVAVFVTSPSSQNKTKFIELLREFLDEKVLKEHYFVKPGLEFPLSHDFIKYYFVLNFAKKNIGHGDPVQRALLDKAEARVFTLLTIDWENRSVDDPAFAMVHPVLESMSKKHSGTSGDAVASFIFPPQINPALTVHGGKKAVILLRPDQFGDSTTSELTLVTLQDSAGFEQVEFIGVREFFSDTDYQSQLKFDLRPDLDTFIADKLSLKDATGLQHMERFIDAMTYNNLSGRNTPEFESLIVDYGVILKKLHQQRLEIIPAKFPQVYNRILAQYYFLAAYLFKYTSVHLPQWRSVKVAELLKDLRVEYEHSHLMDRFGESTWLKNRHFGMEPYEESPGSVDPAFNFLNLKAFSNPEYFIFPLWKERMVPLMGTVQFAESESTFFNRFGKLKRVIIPNVSGRKLTNPPFQLFWEDMLRPDTPADRKRAIKYQEYSEKQRTAALTPDDSWRLAILNFIYEFRAKKDVAKTFSHLCRMDLWKNLATLIASSPNQAPRGSRYKPGQLVFTAQDLSYFFDVTVPVHRQNSAYQTSMKHKLEMRDKVTSIQHRLNKELPEEYRQADGDVKRQNLFTEFVKLQKEYVQTLEDYQKTVDPHDNIAKDTEVKDLVYRLEGSVKQLKLTENDQKKSHFFKNTEEAVKFCTLFSFELVALYKQSTNVGLSEAEQTALSSLASPTFQLLSKDYANDFAVYQTSLKEILSESDEMFLMLEFPNMAVQKFMDRPVHDFLCAFAILGEVSNVNNIRNQDVIKANVTELFKDAKSNVLEDLAETMTILPKNSLRFYQNYLETKKWHEASSISAEDLKTFKEILSLTRSNLIRGGGVQSEVADPRSQSLRNVRRKMQRSIGGAPQRLH